MKNINYVVWSIAMAIALTGCKKEEPETIPVLSTTPASNITASTAMSGGSILDDGGASVIANGVCWGINPNPSTTESKTVDAVGAAQFISNINGLSPGSTYHVRGYATNSIGTAYGADLIFTTLGQVPSSLVQSATGISATSATLNGTVNPNDLSTIVTFEYGTTSSYGSSVAATPSPVTGNTMANVSVEVTGLLPATTYHYRVKTVNSLGTTYSEDKTFTTAGQSPTVTTTDATNKTTTGATLNGTVNANNTSSTVTFEYGLTINYGQSIMATQSPVTGYLNTTVSAGITGLAAGTTYHYRVKAVNSIGTTLGNDMTFTTLGLAPSATTLAACCLSTTGATLNGNVNANNASTTVTFEYGTTTSYGQTVTASQSPVSGNTSSNVSASISGLIAGTTYHFRVKAVNSVGTTYGSDMNLTVPYSPPPTNGLVGYWSFSGNANDESSNNNNGSVTNAILTTDRFGNSNKAYSFDGDGDYILVPDNDILSLVSHNFSFSFWVYINPGAGTDVNMGLISKRRFDSMDASNWEYDLAYDGATGNNIRFWFSGLNGKCPTYPGIDYYASENGQWIHCVATADNVSLKIYKDGILMSETPRNLSCSQGNGTGPLVFGRGGGWNQIYYLNGMLDDIRIYNRFLSDDEIQRLYHEGGW